VEYEYLESYDVTLESSEDAACSADEMVSIEPANSAPEESVYSLSPKPEAAEEDDSGHDPDCRRSWERRQNWSWKQLHGQNHGLLLLRK